MKKDKIKQDELISWNDKVTILPNAIGWKIWKDHWEQLRVTPERNNGVALTLPLWEIASIFGQHLYNGCKLPFKNTAILLNGRLKV
jgi:hypothetical protein